MRLLVAALLLGAPLAALAQVTGPACPGGPANPITWYLSGVQFNDGGSASGSFVYDANNGVFSAVSITTTPGTAFAGAHYSAVLAGCQPTNVFDAVTRSGIADYTGLPMLILGANAVFTNAGGTLPLLTSGGASFEQVCPTSVCSITTPTRTIISGLVTTNPPPSSVPSLSPFGSLALTLALLATAVMLMRRGVAA